MLIRRPPELHRPPDGLLAREYLRNDRGLYLPAKKRRGLYLAPSATNIGTASGASGATLSITVGAGGVPAGALLVLCSCELSNNIPGGSVTDTPGNSWAFAIRGELNLTQSDGFGAIFYAYNSLALSNGNTIVYHRQGSGASVAISALYVLGVLATANPLDVTAGGGGNSTTPSHDGFPTASNDVWVCNLACTGNAGAFTQDSIHGAWATPPNQVTAGTLSSNARVNGGWLQESGSAKQTYAPGVGTTVNWALLMASFKVPGGIFRQSALDGISIGGAMRGDTMASA